MSRTIVVVNERIIALEKKSKALKCEENIFLEDFSAEKGSGSNLPTLTNRFSEKVLMEKSLVHIMIRESNH